MSPLVALIGSRITSWVAMGPGRRARLSLSGRIHQHHEGGHWALVADDGRVPRERVSSAASHLCRLNLWRGPGPSLGLMGKLELKG